MIRLDMINIRFRIFYVSSFKKIQLSLVYAIKHINQFKIIIKHFWSLIYYKSINTFNILIVNSEPLEVKIITVVK